jgi:hypothetical protein
MDADVTIDHHVDWNARVPSRRLPRPRKAGRLTPQRGGSLRELREAPASTSLRASDFRARGDCRDTKEPRERNLLEAEREACRRHKVRPLPVRGARERTDIYLQTTQGQTAGRAYEYMGSLANDGRAHPLPVRGAREKTDRERERARVRLNAGAAEHRHPRSRRRASSAHPNTPPRRGGARAHRISSSISSPCGQGCRPTPIRDRKYSKRGRGRDLVNMSTKFFLVGI